MTKRLTRLMRDELAKLTQLMYQSDKSVSSKLYAVKKLRRLEDSLEDMNHQLDRFKVLLW